MWYGSRKTLQEPVLILILLTLMHLTIRLLPACICFTQCIKEVSQLYVICYASSESAASIKDAYKFISLSLSLLILFNETLNAVIQLERKFIQLFGCRGFSSLWLCTK